MTLHNTVVISNQRWVEPALNCPVCKRDFINYIL
jgi:hypothetical protein